MRGVGGIGKIERYLRMISQGIALSLVALAVLFGLNDSAFVDRFIIRQAVPGYNNREAMQGMLRFVDARSFLGIHDDTAIPAIGRLLRPDDLHITGGEAITILGAADVIFQYASESYLGVGGHFAGTFYTLDDIAIFRDFNRLRNSFYIVDRRTNMTPDLFNVDAFMSHDLRFSRDVDGPRVLIFHTHSQEMFADSRGMGEGIMAVGARLAQMLEHRHGIPALHITESFDIVDGQSNIMGAYERMEPRIRQVLADNPSIEVVIDLHRDGVPENVRLVTDINGRPTAQIMFFNGLSRVYRDGVLTNIYSLPNPYLDTNLAFSFQMQLAANAMFPGITRKIYLNAFRYSLHMKPRSLLIELGAQTNTLQEALNAVEPLSDMLAAVLLGQD